MELNVPGITNLDIPIDAQAKGEAGLGHWRRALNGYCVDSTLDASRICGKVLEELNFEGTGVVIVFKPQRVSLRGRYGRGRIQLFGPPRLATLLHELAHHVVRERFPRAKSHGKEFKRVFVQVFQAFGVAYDVAIARAAKAAKAATSEEIHAIKIGDVVQTAGGLDGRKFKVTGRARTRLILECTRTGRGGFRANPVHLEVVTA
jgi:preprotein translocase subunit YajC